MAYELLGFTEPPPPPPPPPELPDDFGCTDTLKVLYSTALPYCTLAVRVTVTALDEGLDTIPLANNTLSLLLFHVIFEPFILPVVSIVIFETILSPLRTHVIASASALAFSASPVVPDPFFLDEHFKILRLKNVINLHFCGNCYKCILIYILRLC